MATNQSTAETNRLHLIKDPRGGPRPQKFATKRSVAKAVENMTAEQVHCRTLGHVWAHRQVTRILGGYEQVLGCKNCSSEKIQMINKKGEVQESKLRYSPGYLLKGLGRLKAETKAIVRVASLEYVIGDQE